MAESVGLALLVVLERLAPGERVAFVLHDVFAVPFEDLALIVRRSPAVARQFAGRSRCRGLGTAAGSDADLSQHGEVVEALLSALQAGDVDVLPSIQDEAAARVERLLTGWSVVSPEKAFGAGRKALVIALEGRRVLPGLLFGG